MIAISWLLLVVGLAALVALSRSTRIDRWLTAAARLLGRHGRLPTRDLSG